MKKLTVIAVILSAIVFESCGPSAVVVKERPVAPVVIRSAMPAPGYVWVEGNYVRGRSGYIYKQGYWAAPRRGRTIYTSGYWAPARNGYRWHRGRW